MRILALLAQCLLAASCAAFAPSSIVLRSAGYRDAIAVGGRAPPGLRLAARPGRKTLGLAMAAGGAKKAEKKKAAAETIPEMMTETTKVPTETTKAPESFEFQAEVREGSCVLRRGFKFEV